MRSPSAWAVAVRKPDGEIARVNNEVSSILTRHRWMRLPVIRGVFALGEALTIGFRALAISANYASQEEGEDGEPGAELTRGQLLFAFAVAIGFVLLLFKVGPALITDRLPVGDSAGFVIVEGVIRVAIFFVYLSLISLLPDLRRVFQYHAAEHKAINAYEAGQELKPDIVQRFSLIHVPLRDRLPPLRHGRRDLRVRLFRASGLVLVDRNADPAPPRDRRHRLRDHSLRRQPPGQQRPEDLPLPRARAPSGSRPGSPRSTRSRSRSRHSRKC